AYLVRTDSESEPFEDLVDTETPESPHTVASPTCHVEESKDSNTSGVRSTSSDSTAPLSLDHPLTHTTLVLVPALRRTARMVVRIPPTMSPGLFDSIAEVAAMPDSAFCKRFRSSYDRDEEVEESLDSNSKSEYAKEEGTTVEDKDPAAGDEGLVAMDGGLGGDETVPEDQQGEASVVETAMGEPLGLGYGELRRWEIASKEGQMPSVFEPTLTTWIDPKDGRTYIDVPAYPPPAPPVLTPPSLEWSSGSLSVSQATSIVSSHISSHMISLTVPSSVASPTTAEAEGFLTELGAQVEMQGGLFRDHTVRLGELSPALFDRYDRDIWELFTRPVLALEACAWHVDTRMTNMSWAGYDDLHDMLLQQVDLQRELQEMRGCVTVLEKEMNHRER
nr:hypothetical protein [Tanacetum cinerariifolium]